MTRQEHLKFCKVCVNRDMDLNVGITCKLTGKIADFENECSSYELDENEVSKMNNDTEFVRDEITGKITEATLDQLKSEQNLPAGIISGIVVGIFAAILWAAITVATELQIGIVAIAVGAAVGYAIRFVGKGIDQIFGITGAIIAILSCVLGNFLSIIGFISINEDLSYFETLMLFDYSYTFDLMSEAASPMDLVFYGIAAFEGYKFSFRQFTEKALYDLENRTN
ncbi:hypothetical protein [Winogradskyella sp.]